MCNLEASYLILGLHLLMLLKIQLQRMLKMHFLIRFISIPSFNKRPITLNGMPNLIRGLAIYFEIFGFFFPRRKPKIKKGIILIKRE